MEDIWSSNLSLKVSSRSSNKTPYPISMSQTDTQLGVLVESVVSDHTRRYHSSLSLVGSSWCCCSQAEAGMPWRGATLTQCFTSAWLSRTGNLFCLVNQWINLSLDRYCSNFKAEYNIKVKCYYQITELKKLSGAKT